MGNELTPESKAAHAALIALLPPAKVCGMCRGRGFDPDKPELISPTLGKIDLSDGGEIDAAIFDCRLCGAVETTPIR